MGTALRCVITGTRLRGIEYVVPVASAQVKTCLLFAGLLAEGSTTVEEPTRTRDHGELALRAFGAEVTRSRNSVTIAGRPGAASAGGVHSRRQLVGGVLPVRGGDLSRSRIS